MRWIAFFICVLALSAVIGTGAYCEADATQTQPPADSAKPSEPAAPPAASAKHSEPGKPYTSVIIDATGLGIERFMTPKIQRANGSPIWGKAEVAHDFAVEHGVVGYACSMDDAKKSVRCGANPMIIKATARAGGEFRSDPVLSDADADLLLAEDKIGKFLDKFNVIFIKDGKL